MKKLVLSMFLVLATVVEAKASFIAATDFTGGVNGSAGGPETVGYSFTTNSSFTVDALGLWSGSVTSGAFTVRLYQNGASTNLASVTVSSSDPLSSATTNGVQYRYHALTAPVVLTSSTTYDIVFDTSSGVGEEFSTTGHALDSRITFGSGRNADPGNGAFPTGDADGSGPYFGPSFEIASTPEPSSLILAGVSMAGLALYRRPKSKRI